MRRNLRLGTLVVPLFGWASMCLGESFSFNTIDSPDVVPTVGQFYGTTAVALNNSRQVVGTVTEHSIVTNSFLESKGLFTTIAFPGATLTTVTGVNNLGQVIGASSKSGPSQLNGFLYSNGNYETLPFVPNGINDVGQIVGLSSFPSGASRNILVDTNGSITTIAPLRDS